MNEKYFNQIKLFLTKYNDDKSYLISYIILPIFKKNYEEIDSDRSYISKLGLQLSVQNIKFNEDEFN